MKKLHVGEILDDQVEFTLNELCSVCHSEEEWIIKLIEEGVVEVKGENYENWRFSGTSLRRVHSAMRLERDLNINVAGVALALDLMDEIEQLRIRINLYEHSHD